VPDGARALKVLRAAQRPAVPWKNGGGITREVAIWPTGATPGEFDWRVSIAEIAVAGPFSVFAGIDRRMSVLKGRLSLKIQAQPAVILSPDSAVIAFPGEAPVFATPLGATVTDLNVMTRRGRCTADLTRHAAAVVLEPRGGTTLLIARSALKASAAEHGAELALLDVLVLGSEPVSVLAAGVSPVSFDLVEIRCAGGE
jgi:uncharacterized protein